MKGTSFIKQRKNAALIAVCVFALGISSCSKDFLDLSPTTSIKNTEAFNSPEKLKAAMTGIYDLSTNSAYTNNMLMNADMKGEDVLVNSTNNYNRFLNGYRFVETVTASEPLAYWQYGYRIIANANQLIENTPNAPVTDAVKKRYIAEARAMRAATHFNLVRWYAKPYALDPEALGVPVVEKSIGPNESFPARAKVKDVYASIIADLTFAKDNFPASEKDQYRITLNAIQGLLARVYLTMGDWKNASDYAKLARAGRPLASANSLLAGFADLTSEWIWANNMRTDDNQGFLQVSSFYDPYDDGYSSFRASKDFYNLFDNNDIRKNQFKIPAKRGDDPSTGTAKILGDGYLISKFIFRGTWDNQQLLMRSSEMYLIEAEAEARLGNDLAAQTALFEIQKRAGVAAVPSANTGAALIQEILLERRKELFGEGHRFYDILRTKQTLVKTKPNHWIDLNLPAGDNKMVFPIPQAEMDANPSLKGQQNPGY